MYFRLSCSLPYKIAAVGLCGILIGGMLLLAGCEEASSAKKAPSTKKATSFTPPPKRKPVDPNAYASVDEALAAAQAGLTDASKAKDVGVVQEWLLLKGSSIQPQLIATVKDAQAQKEIRVLCCRVLAQLGPVAIPTLKETVEAKSYPDALRQNAVDCLGMVKPTNKDVIDYLFALGWGQDEKVRLAAMRGMAKIGPPVKDAHPEVVDKLKEVLNSQTEDEILRNQAKTTLKSVEPRVGFSGMGKADK